MHGLGTSLILLILICLSSLTTPSRVLRLLPLLSLHWVKTALITTMVSLAYNPRNASFLYPQLIFFRYSSVVSVADGFNLPIQITNNKGCHYATCAADLNANCMLLPCCSPRLVVTTHHASHMYEGPDPLKGPKDSRGQLVGCNSACAAGLGGPHGTPPHPHLRCCSI